MPVLEDMKRDDDVFETVAFAVARWCGFLLNAFAVDDKPRSVNATNPYFMFESLACSVLCRTLVDSS